MSCSSTVVCHRPLEISGPLQLTDQATAQKLNLALDQPDGATTLQHASPAHMKPGTLPFGGGWEGEGLGTGGTTTHSNVSDASAIAEELRGVVRTELKKLVEV